MFNPFEKLEEQVDLLAKTETKCEKELTKTESRLTIAIDNLAVVSIILLALYFKFC